MSRFTDLCRQPLELNELLVYVVYFSAYPSLISYCLVYPSTQTVISDFISGQTAHLHVTIHRSLTLLKHDQKILKCNLEYLSFRKKNYPRVRQNIMQKLKTFQTFIHSKIKSCQEPCLAHEYHTPILSLSKSISI